MRGTEEHLKIERINLVYPVLERTHLGQRVEPGGRCRDQQQSRALSLEECTRLWLVVDEGSEEKKRKKVGFMSPEGGPYVIYRGDWLQAFEADSYL